MSGRPLAARLQSLLWSHGQAWRRPLRRVRLGLSLAAHRLRRMARPSVTLPRVVEHEAEARPTLAPLVSVVVEGCDRAAIDRFLTRQTERSVTTDATAAAAFVFAPTGELEELPPTHLEAMALAAVAGDLDLVVAGWSAPAASAKAPAGVVHRRSTADPASHLLLRRPEAPRRHGGPLVGRTVSHICSPHDLAAAVPLELPGVRSGPHLLRGDVGPGAVVRHPVRPLAESLAGVPSEPGPRTVLFLLPSLAVGGAERLLYDLLWGLAGRCRALVVTLEPHLSSLGQTVDLCRDLTPHCYTLGDWLPREALLGALRHLIRRWQVWTLVSWNGTVSFFDHAPALKAEFPGLRIASQLYNHRGAWIDRTTPALIEAVDLHLAVNSRIAEALERERGVPRDRIATIYHAVEVPEQPSRAEAERRRRARRRQLGLPLEAVVVGSFARMHPQKRPFDLIRLARRMANRNLHFLLVGGGPLDRAVDRELARRPLHNLTRLPFRHDTDELFEAVDICLLVSEYEGLPVFLLEGMARGIPAVATAVGDIPYLLQEGGGVAPGPPGDLAALERALESLLDDRRRADEGERARARVVSHFGLDRYVREYEAALFPQANGAVSPG